MRKITRRKRCNSKKSLDKNNEKSNIGRRSYVHKKGIVKKELKKSSRDSRYRKSTNNTISYRRRVKRENNSSNHNMFKDRYGKRIRRVYKAHNKLKRVSYYNKRNNEITDETTLILIKQILEKIKKIVFTSKVRKVSRGILIALMSLVPIDMIDKANREVFLDVYGQELTWSTSENIDASNYKYKLYRDNELLTYSRGYKFIESISMDKESPKKVGNVTVTEGATDISFIWKEPTDIGSNYTYKIEAVNQSNNKKYKSRKIKEKFISGIDKYLISVNGKEYQTYTTSFSMSTSSFRNGENNIEIVAVDLAGNKSESKKIKFKVDNTSFYLDGYKIGTTNPEITNETHDIYLVKENLVKKDDKLIPQTQKTKVSIGENISQYFIKSTNPKLYNPRYICKDDLVNVVWEETPFGSRNTDFYIEAVEKSTLKKHISTRMNYDAGSFLSGYYYKVTTTPTYKVKTTDDYTMDSSVNLNYDIFNKDKKYYFHLAASDEYGNLSKTKTLEFDFKDFTSVGEVKDTIRTFLYKNKGVTGDDFRTITDDIYNTLRYRTIKKIESMGIKISLTSESAKEFIKKHHNVEPISNEAQYIKEDSTIVYNVNSSLEYLIKEIVKIFDEIPKSAWSKNADFLKVYNEEKTKIKDGKCSPQEFLSEVIWMYISKEDDLEYDAPSTYAFVKRYYKSIMLA